VNKDDTVELVLAPPAPSGLVAALSHIPVAQVRHDDTRSYLRYGTHERDIRLVPRSTVEGPHGLDRLEKTESEEDRQSLLMVVATSLPRSSRRDLAERGISYADARGHLHLRADGLFLYVDIPTEAAKAPPSGRTSGIGLVGVRAIQTLVTFPNAAWAVVELANVAAVSAGEAHKVLTVLEREGLVEARGRGPSRHRQIRDLGGLLDWLADQPRARRVYRHLTCSLYARTPADLAKRASASLDARGISHAFTAGLAAMLLQGGPTSVPRSVLRVEPNRSLEEVADVLGAERTERGANLTLWSDDGLVGTHGRVRHEDTWLAPPVRVYLDLMGDRRGADAAAHFREVVLGA
jgi:hypothetical protein